MTCPLTWFQIIQLARDALAGVTFVVALVFWRRLDRAQRLVAWWLLAAGVVDTIAFFVGCHDLPARRFTIQFWFPVSAPLALGALGALQGSITRRDIFRLAGLGYVFVWAFMLLRMEVLNDYPKYTTETHTLLLIGASVLTIIRRASLARHDLRRDPGFLLASALLVFSVPTLFLSIVSRMWRQTHPTWIHWYIGGHAVISTLCFLVMIYGMYLSARRVERRA